MGGKRLDANTADALRAFLAKSPGGAEQTAKAAWLASQPKAQEKVIAGPQPGSREAADIALAEEMQKKASPPPVDATTAALQQLANAGKGAGPSANALALTGRAIGGAPSNAHAANPFASNKKWTYSDEDGNPLTTGAHTDGIAPGDVQGAQRPAAQPAPLRPNGGGGGGYVAPQMLERDLLGPTQKAALAGYRVAERDYASKWADPYLQMQAQEEALQRQAIEEQKAVANVQAQAEAERSQELADRQAKFDESVQELSNMKIDPGRAMKNSNPIQFAFGAIAAMLGGAQSARTGGPNEGLKMIDQWIDRDIEAQKFAFMAKKEGVQQQQTAFGQAMQRFGDMRQAESVARAALKERFATEAMAMASKSKRADLLDKAAQMQVQLRKSAAEDAQKFIAYGQVGGSGGAQPKHMDLDRERLVSVDGGSFLAATGAEAQKLRDGAASVEQIAALTDEALRLRENKMAFIPGTDAHAQLQGIQSELTFQVKNAQQLGALSGPDMGLVTGATGDVTSWKPGTSEQLKVAARRAKESFQRRLSSQNAPEVVTGFYQDKHGQTKQEMAYTGRTYTPQTESKLRAVADKYGVSK